MKAVVIFVLWIYICVADFSVTLPYWATNRLVVDPNGCFIAVSVNSTTSDVSFSNLAIVSSIWPNGSIHWTYSLPPTNVTRTNSPGLVIDSDRNSVFVIQGPTIFQLDLDDAYLHWTFNYTDSQHDTLDKPYLFVPFLDSRGRLLIAVRGGCAVVDVVHSVVLAVYTTGGNETWLAPVHVNSNGIYAIAFWSKADQQSYTSAVMRMTSAGKVVWEISYDDSFDIPFIPYVFGDGSALISNQTGVDFNKISPTGSIIYSASLQATEGVSLLTVNDQTQIGFLVTCNDDSNCSLTAFDLHHGFTSLWSVFLDNSGSFSSSNPFLDNTGQTVSLLSGGALKQFSQHNGDTVRVQGNVYSPKLYVGPCGWMNTTDSDTYHDESRGDAENVDAESRGEDESGRVDDREMYFVLQSPEWAVVPQSWLEAVTVASG